MSDWNITDIISSLCSWADSFAASQRWNKTMTLISQSDGANDVCEKNNHELRLHFLCRF